MATSALYFKYRDGSEKFKNTACFAQFQDKDWWYKGRAEEEEDKEVTRMGYMYEGSYMNKGEAGTMKNVYTEEYYTLLKRIKEVIPCLNILHMEYRKEATYHYEGEDTYVLKKGFNIEDAPLVYTRLNVKTDKAVFNLFIMRQLIRGIFELKTLLSKLGIDPFEEEDKEVLQAVLYLFVSYQLRWDNIQRRFLMAINCGQPYGLVANSSAQSLFGFTKFVKDDYKFFFKSLKSTKGRYQLYNKSREERAKFKCIQYRYERNPHDNMFSVTDGLCGIFSQGEKEEYFFPESPFFVADELKSMNMAALKGLLIRMVDLIK